MSPLIEVRSLTKRFGSVLAVDGVSFAVERGEVLGFLGPNGAGKSTTMKIITGYLPPSAGSAMVCGRDIETDPIEVKQRVGYLPEGAPLYGDMTPEVFLDFVARIRGLGWRRRRRRVREVIERMGLTEVLYRRIETLSKGFKRRVGIAQAILHDPEVLILDEPTDGLDPNQKHDVRELIREMGSDKAIIISTHLLEEVDAVCDRIVIIDHGRVVMDCSPLEFHEKARDHNAVRLQVPEAAAAAAAAQLRALPEVAAVETGEPADGRVTLLVLPQGGTFIADLVGQAIRRHDIEVAEMRVETGKLDDVFRQATTRN